ncbi:MAG: hypothetical protein AB1523_06575 [Bacillota bacterium]
MQLSPGERSVLAYFPTTASAQEAASELRNAGFETVSVDRISRFGVENDAEINYAVGGRATNLTGLTLYSSGTDVGDERVLPAADPSVSGYGDTNYGVAGGRAFLVTVVAEDGKIDQAVDILKRHGGLV